MRKARNISPTTRLYAVVISLCAVFGFAITTWGDSPKLPRRLVLCLDGVAWRDLKSLQEGTVKDRRGRIRNITAFNHGYYNVSRLVSTFPSCSDPAWTEIFANEALPGYQRTFFDIDANKAVAQNGITTTMQYESQMRWQMKGGWRRSLGYVSPVREFHHELHQLTNDFFRHSEGIETYYAMLRTTDDGQHLAADIFGMLEFLDRTLHQLELSYRAQTGRELEILIISDHGNNHAGPGKRVPIVHFLKRSGYRITNSINDARDVILPTVGIQSWVEIHNAPSETSRLASRLVQLDGVDLIGYRTDSGSNVFVVCNRKGAEALITHDPTGDRYSYQPISGDPLGYQPVVKFMRSNKSLDEDGFAPANVWLAATMTNRYPLALERICRGLTCVTRNPATILLSLDNHYVHAGFYVLLGSRLITCQGTHGGLDDLNSDGILLSNFVETHDTTTFQVASQFDNFPGRNGAPRALPPPPAVAQMSKQQ